MQQNPLIRLTALLVLGSLAAACDTSVGTTQNPDLGGPPSGYNGPPARTGDISDFQTYFYDYFKEPGRCGQCHSSNDEPYFVDTSDVNAAYSAAIAFVDMEDTASSRFVQRVGAVEDHNCWLGSNAECEAKMIERIDLWKDANTASSRAIVLTAPPIREPGAAKSFPALATDNSPASFAETVHPILTGAEPGIPGNNCQGCHEETASPLPIAPFFANDDVASAYEAAKAKMDIDTPANSRLVVRLREESHNCWSADCAADAQVMEDAIAAFAADIEPTQVDADLVTSKALNLGDGIVAAGGSRHESNLIALWEFKEDSGPTAFDGSDIDPVMNLTLIGSVNFMPGYGLNFTGGRAQANTLDSDKLHTFIEGTTRQYAIEAWVVPANVTQEDANIISYSGGNTARNFTLGQRMYNYDFYNRTTDSDGNGEPFFTSDDNDDNEVLQSSLQHVVVNYDPINGREIFVNGQLVPGTTEPTPGPNTVQNVWDDTFAFVLGNEVSGNRPWHGQIRMAAIHNRALTPAQVQQNFDVGVGEKYFLLFYVGHQIGIPGSYILFEVAQFDSHSYLFNRPTFINLDPDWVPVAIDIEGIRIGINGKQAVAGQAFASLRTTIDGSYDPTLGQLLSPIGTIIALEKGQASDEFFLTFERIGSQTHTFADPPPSPSSPPADPGPVESDIGVRTFEEINSTIAAITGIPVTNPVVDGVYDDYIQQLPSVEAIDAFLPSHQMAIAQLALTSCSELVETNPGYFAGFDFGQTARTAFGPLAPGTPNATQQANRDLVIEPLLASVMNVDPADSSNNLTSQPGEGEVRDLLGAGAAQDLDVSLGGDAYDSLVTELINTCTPVPPATTCTPEDTVARTAQIVKAVCAAATGGAVMLVQ